MAAKYDFLCQKCKTVHPVSDSAFDMPEKMLTSIKKKVAKLDEELAPFFEDDKVKNIIRCIEQRDVIGCASLEKTEGGMGTEYVGKLVLRGKWLKSRARALAKHLGPSMKPEYTNKIEKLFTIGDNEELCSEYCRFEFSVHGDEHVPLRIFDSDNTPLSTLRRCAHCGRPLSPVTGTAPELRVVFQGSSVAGKTSLMIAMINELQEQREELLGLRSAVLSDVGDEYTKWMIRELKWYRKGYNILKTEKDQPEPRLYSVKIFVDEKPLVLTMVDMPGEFFDGDNNENAMHVLDKDWFRQYADIYCHCHAIWSFMQYEMVKDVSGTRDETLIKKIEEKTGLPEEALSRVSYEMYEQRFNEVKSYMKNRGKEMPPHAVILTKTDAIIFATNGGEEQRRRLERCGIIRTEQQAGVGGGKKRAEDAELIFSGRRAPNQPKFVVYNEKVAHRMAHFVRDYLRELNPRTFGVLNEFSNRRSFFAVSAYGQTGKDRNKLTDSSTPVYGSTPAYSDADAYSNMPTYGSTPAAPKAPADKKAPADGITPEKAPLNFIPKPYNVANPLLWTLAITGRLAIYYDAEIQSGKGSQIKKVRVGSIDRADQSCVTNLFMQGERYSRHIRRE